MLFGFPDADFAVLVECDEGAHSNRSEISEMEHMQVITNWLRDVHGIERTWTLRVNPDGNAPMFRKELASNGELQWSITPIGEGKMVTILNSIEMVFEAALDCDESALTEYMEGCVGGVCTVKEFY